MGILKDKAEALRLLAAKFEQFGDDLPRTAKEIIRLFAPKDSLLGYTQIVRLEFANDPNFIRHTIKTAGLALGVKIGDGLAARFTGFTRERFAPFERGEARYEAQVVVLTPRQLEELVERAVEIGRTSLL